MNASLNSDTHRYCSQCDTVKLLHEDFAPNPRLTFGRNYTCRACIARYSRARRLRMKQGKPKPIYVDRNDPTPVPAMDLLQSLACIALRKWRYPVNETTRFGVAMIGGGYV